MAPHPHQQLHDRQGPAIVAEYDTVAAGAQHVGRGVEFDSLKIFARCGKHGRPDRCGPSHRVLVDVDASFLFQHTSVISFDDYFHIDLLSRGLCSYEDVECLWAA